MGEYRSNPSLIGSPCIGCGYCCKKARCWVSLHINGTDKRPCPSLVFKDGRYWCEIVQTAVGEDKEKIINELAIGGGCSSALFNSHREAMDGNSFDSEESFLLVAGLLTVDNR